MMSPFPMNWHGPRLHEANRGLVFSDCEGYATFAPSGRFFFPLTSSPSGPT